MRNYASVFKRIFLSPSAVPGLLNIMRFNDSALRQVALQIKPHREGRLLYRGPRESYKERWFRLKGNLLFYCRTNSDGSLLDPEPLGLLVMDQCRVQMEAFGDRPFVFSIHFNGESDKAHYFSGQSLQQCQEWVAALQASSLVLVQSQVQELRNKLKAIHGRDPLDDLIQMPAKNSPNRKVVVAAEPIRAAPKSATLNSRQIDFIACATGTSDGTNPSPQRNSVPVIGKSTFHATLPSPKPKAPPPAAFSIDRLGVNINRAKARSAVESDSPLTPPDLLQLSPPLPASSSQRNQGVILNPAQLHGWEIFE